MRKVWRLALVTALLIGCVGCDQVSKGIARAHLALGESRAFLGDTFRIVHVENAGAFLSVGATLPKLVRIAVFQGAIFLVILGLLWAAVFRRETRPWQVTGFALLAASGLGNLIDRLVFDGRVTDFLNVASVVYGLEFSTSRMSLEWWGSPFSFLRTARPRHLTNRGSGRVRNREPSSYDSAPDAQLDCPGG